MEGSVITLENITALVKPLTKKYHVKEIYLFGSYARGEADENSDLDFLVFGGEGFKLTSILALGEELREVLKKKVDIFEIREVNQDSEFYRTIMREKVVLCQDLVQHKMRNFNYFQLTNSDSLATLAL